MEAGCDFSLDTWGVTKTIDVFTQNFYDHFTTRDWAAVEPWHCLCAENSIDLTSVPRKSDAPFFWVSGDVDDLVREPGSRHNFDTLCAAGYRMDFLECKGAGHTEAGMWSMSEQVAWATDRFAGKPLTNPCVQAPPVCCSGATNADCTTP